MFGGSVFTKRISDLLQDVKKVGFLGFGKSNRALHDYLSRHFKLDFVIRDERSVLKDAPSSCALLLGERCFEPASEDIVFLSPSVRRERAKISKLCACGASLSSDAELFFKTEPENVIAVTGSDGKSTTSSLAASMLSASGIKARAVGNFGVPMTPLSEDKDTFFVAELSSFMLRYMKPSSRRALITNVTPNHLNWHASFEEYAKTKLNVLANTDEAVMNFDCYISRSALSPTHPYAVFSAEIPFSELKSSVSSEVYFTLEDGFLSRNGIPLLSCGEIAPVGLHNVKNALAALALTDGIADTDAAVGALRSFRALAHRCELVGEHCGLKYYDSSIDSTPERTRVTLGAFDRPVTVILGGRDKGLSYEPLLDALRGGAAAAVIFGENRDALYEFLTRGSLPCPVFLAEDMDEAVDAASGLGHDVLLSPGATSYDRYSNFEEKGHDFARAVKNLRK